MSAEIFNPNPTIFITTKLRSPSAFSKGNSLWLDDGDDSDLEERRDDSPEIEDIDREEIFGSFVYFFLIYANINTSFRTHPIDF